LGRSRGSLGFRDRAPQYFPGGESGAIVMKSVSAQLSFSKGAWFREDESPVDER
jgi:hypothetical protein